MSIGAINWVLGDRGSRSAPLTGPTKSNRLVLLILANFANDEDDAWPSIDTICSQAALEQRAVKDALKWLLSNGYLSISMQSAPLKKGQRADRRTNVYHLNRSVETGNGGTVSVSDVHDGGTVSVNEQVNGGTVSVQELTRTVPLNSREAPSTTTTIEPLPVGKKASSPEMVKAREIVRAWYDYSQAHTGADPTAQPFPAVMKVAAALLKVYPEKVVKQSLVDAAKVGTVSIGSCEIAIKRGGGVKASPVRGPVVDRAELDRQADERQRADDELFAAGRPTFKPLGKVVL